MKSHVCGKNLSVFSSSLIRASFLLNNTFHLRVRLWLRQKLSALVYTITSTIFSIIAPL